jgi:hypothetical protein
MIDAPDTGAVGRGATVWLLDEAAAAQAVVVAY